MNRRNPIALLIGWLALAAAPTHTAQAADSSPAAAAAQQSGVITGRVSNAGTQSNLEGATVILAGTSFSTYSSRDGTYRLQVPPGTYTLRAFYTGLDEQTVPLSVQAGRTTVQDFPLTAEIYKLGQYVVSGEREGNALAITLQRHAPNVKNVVSADAFGALAGNPADLVARLPGVVGESVDGDFRYLWIRGMHRDLSTITTDGNRMADAASEARPGNSSSRPSAPTRSGGSNPA